MADRWKVLWLVAFARLALGFQVQSVGAVAPVLSPQLGLSLTDIGTAVGAYLLPGVFLALPGAALGNRVGERRTLVLGLLLMALGGFGCALATDAATLFAARLLAGAGGVLFNVVSTKMIADWFAGREIVLAMSIYISTWPIGMALALPVLSAVAAQAGTVWAFCATSVFACAGLVALLARPLSAPVAPVAPLGLSRLDAREWGLAVLLGGSAWSLYNVAFAALASFLPLLLAARGASPAQAGAVSTALVVGVIVSIQLAGWAISRVGRPNLMAFAGLAGWAVCTGGLLSEAPAAPLLVVGGILSGFATGSLVSLPAQVLRPEVRATGMGAFYTVYYLGMAILPGALGRLADRAGTVESLPGLVAAVIVTVMLLLATVRWLQRSKGPLETVAGR